MSLNLAKIRLLLKVFSVIKILQVLQLEWYSEMEKVRFGEYLVTAVFRIDETIYLLVP